MTFNNALNEVLKKVAPSEAKRREKNLKKGEKLWALVSQEDGTPLKYFGKEKPSKKTVDKEEKRIQYFKHKG
ncbi:MAG: hypothetical protein ACOCP4_04825 [Candidatus Woesearchaeota archaeon]